METKENNLFLIPFRTIQERITEQMEERHKYKKIEFILKIIKNFRMPQMLFFLTKSTLTSSIHLKVQIQKLWAYCNYYSTNCCLIVSTLICKRCGIWVKFKINFLILVKKVLNEAPDAIKDAFLNVSRIGHLTPEGIF